ncbi:MAG: 16S rRNA (guanine(527)-N(7))-methyltransferase RsmG [Clostridia bacterium]|nr:16S rRNA (guanine(527)-N(7))-methyltransferase RsmG [Clostridia bacterium]
MREDNRREINEAELEPVPEFDIKDELIAKAKEIGVKVKKDQAEKFQRYLELLLDWNRKINLTAITDPHEAVIKHFVDSLTFVKTVKIKEGAKIIDVGTGAGFPGIPIKIMRPDVKLTLLDGLNKRLVFLKEVCNELDIEAEFVHKRAEEAGKLKEMRQSYDIACARAVARMNTLAEYCIPLIKMKGLFVAMKGPGLEEEMTEAENAIEILGCKVNQTEKIILPDAEHSERNIAVMQKIDWTPKEYPRHGNKISKSPIV